jgi:hypothetical protein
MLGKRCAPARPAVADVEPHVRLAAALHLAVDGARHHVARRQLGAAVVARHEARAVERAQHGALAAQRLAEQERLRLRVVEAGGMELHELEVRDRRAGAVGHREAVAGRDVGLVV